MTGESIDVPTLLATSPLIDRFSHKSNGIICTRDVEGRPRRRSSPACLKCSNRSKVTQRLKALSSIADNEMNSDCDLSFTRIYSVCLTRPNHARRESKSCLIRVTHQPFRNRWTRCAHSTRVISACAVFSIYTRVHTFVWTITQTQYSQHREIVN